MAIAEITDVRPNGNSFAEGRLNPPTELLAPLWPQMERRLMGMSFCAETLFSPQWRTRILSSLLSQVIYPKRCLAEESWLPALQSLRHWA